MNTTTKHVIRAAALCVACVLACLMGGCMASADTSKQLNLAPLEDTYALADMSGYACAEGYEAPYRFVDMTVNDVVAEMEAGSSFILFCSYKDCPWCNAILNPLNDILTERDIYAAYIDTRKDPSWKSNTDIDNYDTFVQVFGSQLKNDESGQPHLYVPHTFFIKDGVLISSRQGTVEDQEEPSDPLTEEQLQEYHDIINESLNAIG